MIDCSVFSAECLSGLSSTGYGQEQAVTFTVHNQGVPMVLKKALGKVISNHGFCMGRIAWSGETVHIPMGKFGLGCLNFLVEMVLSLKNHSNSSLLWVMWMW